ncbi:hypothetical protein D3C76_300710 [compost metagenome]
MSTIDKRWDGLVTTGQLPIGVYYAGTRHRDFTLRTAVAGDLISVQEAHPQASLHLATLAVYQRQLVALGDIPAEALTLELLRDNLTEIDLAALAEADAALEKKLRAPSEPSVAGEPSSMPSSEQATG